MERTWETGEYDRSRERERDERRARHIERIFLFIIIYSRTHIIQVTK